MNRRQFIAATTTAAFVAPGIGFGAESKPVNGLPKTPYC